MAMDTWFATRKKDPSLANPMNFPRSSVIRDSITTPLVICYSLLLKMAIEIVALPMKNGGSFHCFWYVYQRRNHARNLGRGWRFPTSWGYPSHGPSPWWRLGIPWLKEAIRVLWYAHEFTTGWWLSPTPTQPLWKIWVTESSVGIFWNSQLKMGKSLKIPWFQSPPTRP